MSTPLNNKKVLVTGSCGFIGPNLIEELLAQGARVVALDLPNADWAKLKGLNLTKQIKADILDKNSLKDVVKDINIVYHLAARTDIDGRKLSSYKVNYEGTKNIIEATNSKLLERFMFYSTQLVIGIYNETRFIDETENYRTKTAYGQSKIEGEKVVIENCKMLKIPYTIIRPTSVYGPRGEAPFKQFFRAIKNRRYFHIGKAENLVSWVYVKNLINLTILASISKKAENEIYVGNDFHPYTMREIVDKVSNYYGTKLITVPNFIITPVAYIMGVFKLVGIPVPIYPFRLRNLKANYCYNIQKSLELGYMPKYNLEKGITETLDWYEANKLI